MNRERSFSFSPTSASRRTLPHFPLQVHRARLLNGEEVAVKLQYPGLREAVRSDLGTMKRLSRLAAYFFPDYRWVWGGG